MGTEYLSRGQRGRDVAFTNHSHIALRLKKECSYISTSPLGLKCMLYEELKLLQYYNRPVVQKLQLKKKTSSFKHAA